MVQRHAETNEAIRNLFSSSGPKWNIEQAVPARADLVNIPQQLIPELQRPPAKYAEHVHCTGSQTTDTIARQVSPLLTGTGFNHLSRPLGRQSLLV